MPSQLHESHLLLFRNQPALAAQLISEIMDDSVARWAARRIELGGVHYFAPDVLGPSRVPEIDDEAQARANPELAVLSAMAHGRDQHAERALRIAIGH